MFCSRECQKADWKAGHKIWCGVAGEINVDYDIWEAEGKGLGVFALRDFKRGDKIMVEKPLTTSPHGPIPKAAAYAVGQLKPEIGTLEGVALFPQFSCSIES